MDETLGLIREIHPFRDTRGRFCIEAIRDIALIFLVYVTSIFYIRATRFT